MNDQTVKVHGTELVFSRAYLSRVLEKMRKDREE